jgi:hypothetical protein
LLLSSFNINRKLKRATRKMKLLLKRPAGTGKAGGHLKQTFSRRSAAKDRLIPVQQYVSQRNGTLRP